MQAFENLSRSHTVVHRPQKEALAGTLHSSYASFVTFRVEIHQFILNTT